MAESPIEKTGSYVLILGQVPFILVLHDIDLFSWKPPFQKSKEKTIDDKHNNIDRSGENSEIISSISR